MITTDNEEIAKKAKMIRNHGMIGRDQHVILGYNYRMSEINAAIGLVQLKKLEELNQKRIENSLYLLEQINDRIEWLKVPELKDYVKHTFFWCPVIVLENVIGMKTPELVKKLGEYGVEVRYRYREPLYKQKVLIDLSPYPKNCPYLCAKRQIDYRNIYLPNVEKIAGKIIGLPNHPGLGIEDLDYVIETLEKIGRGI